MNHEQAQGVERRAARRAVDAAYRAGTIDEATRTARLAALDADRTGHVAGPVVTFGPAPVVYGPPMALDAAAPTRSPMPPAEREAFVAAMRATIGTPQRLAQPFTADRRREALSATPAGRAVLAQEDVATAKAKAQEETAAFAQSEHGKLLALTALGQRVLEERRG